MVLTTDEIIHLYSILEKVFEGFHYYEYPLVHTQSEDISHFDGTHDNLSFVEEDEFDPSTLGRKVQADAGYTDVKTVRKFNHVDGNMSVLAYPGEILGAGEYGSVYAIQVTIPRDDEADQPTQIVDLVLKIQDAPLPAFLEDRVLEPNMMVEQIPSTLSAVNSYIHEASMLTTQKGPRPEHHERRIECEAWYVEPIVLHAIQDSTTIPDHIKQMWPMLYASLIVRNQTGDCKSLLLMQRFRSVSTLDQVLKKYRKQQQPIALDLPKVCHQLFETLFVVQGGLSDPRMVIGRSLSSATQSTCIGPLLDLHGDNVLVDEETSELRFIDPALGVFHYDGIRFESKYTEPQWVNERSNLKLLVNLARSPTYAWFRQHQHAELLELLELSATYGTGARQMVTKRALELLELWSTGDTNYKTNYELHVGSGGSGVVGGVDDSNLVQRFETYSRQKSIYQRVWLLYSELVYEVDAQFTIAKLNSLLQWCRYLSKLTVVFNDTTSNGPIRITLPSPLMEHVTFASAIPRHVVLVNVVNRSMLKYGDAGPEYAHVTVSFETASPAVAMLPNSHLISQPPLVLQQHQPHTPLDAIPMPKIVPFRAPIKPAAATKFQQVALTARPLRFGVTTRTPIGTHNQPVEKRRKREDGPHYDDDDVSIATMDSDDVLASDSEDF